ncbi:hypothetical protein INR49_017333 [Caranx melampygus]|nr:hypothetical protein INR49_017333 [Caranx melampygus]
MTSHTLSTPPHPLQHEAPLWMDTLHRLHEDTLSGGHVSHPMRLDFVFKACAAAFIPTLLGITNSSTSSGRLKTTAKLPVTYLHVSRDIKGTQVDKRLLQQQQ